jgi:UDP-N-acetyl-2-amino-2-deoxyglucuronate dehydrogenase
MVRVSFEGEYREANHRMNVGIIGTGAIARKHAQAYRNIGFRLVVCTNSTTERGPKFSEETGADFVLTDEELFRRTDIDFIDVCTFPAYRLPPIELGAEHGKHVLVQRRA